MRDTEPRRGWEALKEAVMVAAIMAGVTSASLYVGLWLLEQRRQAIPLTAPAASPTPRSGSEPAPPALPTPDAPVVSPPETGRVESDAGSGKPAPSTAARMEPPIERTPESPPAPIAPQPEPTEPPSAEPPEVTFEPLRESPAASLREPPPASVPTPAPVTPELSSQGELAAVQRVLDRFRQMYAQLDASAAKSIWPSVDSRALERIFARLQQQELNFDGCAIALSESTATAQCTGSLHYVPRVGNPEPHYERHSWTIELQRTNETWAIVQVRAQ